MHTPLRDLEDLQREAERLARSLHPKENEATLVTLTGELGAGKTAFVQEVAKALGVSEAVTSPTFVLQKTYPLVGQSFTRFVHIDAYRLQEGRELVHLDFHELMKDPQTLVFLEWPEQVQDKLPTPTMRITLLVEEDGTRNISYE